MEFDLENPLADLQDDDNNRTLHSLFHLESDHMVSPNYAHNLQNMGSHVSLRRETVSLISRFSEKIHPLVSYLAVNYLDRFFASKGMPQAKTWMVRLLAVSCVSLAAKMMKAEITLSHIQSGDGFVFDSQTIERMEFLILGSLQWRMRSITPFAFLYFFISLFKLKDPPSRQALKARGLENILKSQNETKLLVFKPSILAASALLSASHELFPIQFPCFHRAISTCSLVNKETLSSCYREIQGILMEAYKSGPDSHDRGSPGAASTSHTPVNVLDQNWSPSSSMTGTGTGTKHHKVRPQQLW